MRAPIREAHARLRARGLTAAVALVAALTGMGCRTAESETSEPAEPAETTFRATPTSEVAPTASTPRPATSGSDRSAAPSASARPPVAGMPQIPGMPSMPDLSGIPGMPDLSQIPGLTPEPEPTGPTLFEQPRDAAAAIVGKLKGNDKILSLALYPRYALVALPDPSASDRALHWRVANGKVAPFGRPTPATGTGGKDVAGCVFSFGSIDVTVVPKIAKSAAAELGKPDAVPTHILLASCPFEAKPTWSVYAASGYVTYDASGKLKKVTR